MKGLPGASQVPGAARGGCGDHLSQGNKAASSMRRRGTPAQGAAKGEAQLLPGRTRTGSSAARADPQPPTAARGPLRPTGSARPLTTAAPPAPPPHSRLGPPRPPWLPKRLHSLANIKPMPGLDSPPSPQGTQGSARQRWCPRGSRPADAARSGPGPAGGGAERGGQSALPRPAQRPHGARGRPNAHTAAASRHSVRHHVRPPWVSWVGVGAAAGGGGWDGVLQGRAARRGRAFPRAGEEPKGLGSLTAGEGRTARQGSGASGCACSPAAVFSAGVGAAAFCRHRVIRPGGAVAGPRPSSLVVLMAVSSSVYNKAL